MGGTLQKWMFLNYYYCRSAFVLSQQTLPLADLNKFHSNVFHSLSTSHFCFFVVDGLGRYTNINVRVQKKSLIYIFCCNAVFDDVDDDNDEVVNDAGSCKVNEFMHIIVRIILSDCSVGRSCPSSCIAYIWYNF